MPRVIAGSAGGLRIDAPPGDETRPTSDRVKEALFSSLGDLTDLAVADLYAGSGGLGIEALSRGARTVTFVDSDRRAIDVVRTNLARTGFGGRARVVRSSVAAFAATPTGGPFDLVLVDPPYARSLAEIASELAALAGAAGITQGARVVIERDRRTDEPIPRLLSHVKDRTYGDTVLRFFAYDGPPHLSPAPDPLNDPLEKDDR